MRKILGSVALATALVAGAFLGSQPANAMAFDFTFTQVGSPSACCGPFDVSATLIATPSGGNFDITGIFGTVTQNGTSFAITGLGTPPHDPSISPPGPYFNFDNVIFTTGGGAPYSFDNGGVGFFVAGIANQYFPSEPTTFFNVWGNGGTSGTLATTASNNVNANFNGNLSISATPLPSTWTMLIAAFAGFGFLAYRGTKKSSAAIAAA